MTSNALLRARRRKERWSEEDARLYRRHRWRPGGFHGEAKSRHGLAPAVRRGLRNMRIQAFLTAAAVNPKRLATALAGLLVLLLTLVMVEAEADVLAHMAFPAQHRAKIRSNHPLDRLNGEIKRRTNVVGQGTPLPAPQRGRTMIGRSTAPAA